MLQRYLQGYRKVAGTSYSHDIVPQFAKEHPMKRALVTLATLAAMGGLFVCVALQVPRLEKIR